jgi:hypothetical protein
LQGQERSFYNELISVYHYSLRLGSVFTPVFSWGTTGSGHSGAIGASKATTSKGTAPQGTLTINVSQLSGHGVGMNTSLGTFQIQITDATCATVNGITLRAPATFILHYRKKELQKLD